MLKNVSSVTVICQLNFLQILLKTLSRTNEFVAMVTINPSCDRSVFLFERKANKSILLLEKRQFISE